MRGGWGADERRMGGQVEWRMGRRAEWRTSGWGGRAIDRFLKGKTPNLTLQLIWLSEIQRGRLRVTVKLPHLPPPSR